MKLLVRILAALIIGFVICSCASSESAQLRKELKAFMSETVTIPASIHGVDTSGIFFYKDTANHPKSIFMILHHAAGYTPFPVSGIYRF